MKPRFSIIIPVYNRPDEIADLLQSLALQTLHNFEVVICEDGSTVPCIDVVNSYRDRLSITYLSQPNEGRSPARNRAMEAAEGEYMVFFDSDCVIPPTYFATLTAAVDDRPIDCYGGPDAAHPSFSRLQKAISFAMTSPLTTGGIRGGRKSLERFTPRTFNMGISRQVYERVGGFREMFSEDIDYSRRVLAEGFQTCLLTQIPVYHKRRGSLTKFFRQVYIFGRSRITLDRLYPGSLKIVHALPSIALLVGLLLTVASILISPWCLLPIGIYIAALFGSALSVARSISTAALSVIASIVQICGYGLGFAREWLKKVVLRSERDIEAEVKARRGK